MSKEMQTILDNFNNNGVFPKDKEMFAAIGADIIESALNGTTPQFDDIIDMELTMLSWADDNDHPYHAMVCVNCMECYDRGRLNKETGERIW